MENKKNYLTVKYGKVIRRNDLCPCGSGKKYKVCCYDKDKQEEDEKGLKLAKDLIKENNKRRADFALAFKQMKEKQKKEKK